MSLRTRLIPHPASHGSGDCGACWHRCARSRADDRYRITLDVSECGVMAVGVTGTCIVSLQTWLNIFDDAEPQSRWCLRTGDQHAVINFQLKHGLTLDGRFGEHARNALRGEYKYMIDNSVASAEIGVHEVQRGHRGELSKPGMNAVPMAVLCRFSSVRR